MLDSKNQNYEFFDNWGGYKEQTIRFMKSYKILTKSQYCCMMNDDHIDGDKW